MHVYRVAYCNHSYFVYFVRLRTTRNLHALHTYKKCCRGKPARREGGINLRQGSLQKETLTFDNAGATACLVARSTNSLGVVSPQSS